SARLASADFDPMGQRVFTLCSDGDLMEGISSEAASLAGHWRLDNLVWLYDDNKITIDGRTELAFTEDVATRFAAFGWRVLRANGHDASSVRAALQAAGEGTEPKPTLIICTTHIGLGSPNKVDTSGVHGSPLGDAELALVRQGLGWPEERFHVPADVTAWFAERQAAKKAERAAWQAQYAAWRAAEPAKAALFDQLWSGAVPADLWQTLVAAAPPAGATRKTSQKVITAALAQVPGLVGGSADLTGSNGTEVKGGLVGAPGAAGEHYALSFGGRQIPFGIREHAMGAITNGMALHGGLKPFGATFLVFSDYERPAMRLAALSHLPTLFVFTHDSIFLGEDGPTHQAVEHHWALRTIPNLAYWRPADGMEVGMAWAWALEQTKRPAAFAFTRQDLPAIERPAGFDPQVIRQGAYAVSDAADPQVILVGTGSELHLCTGAAERLRADGLRVRVVSMPCVDLFLEQPEAVQEALIPATHPAVVTVEAGITGPWRQIAGRRGLCIGLDRFGASAPAEVLAEKFGFTVDGVYARVKAFLG
ncbi:MAG: transketolase, partial [Myxococcales bacterium]|nr:transketolase [Myxococcales bacterium]